MRLAASCGSPGGPCSFPGAVDGSCAGWARFVVGEFEEEVEPTYAN